LKASAADERRQVQKSIRQSAQPQACGADGKRQADSHIHSDIPTQMYIYFYPSLRIQIYAFSILKMSTNLKLERFTNGSF
jgi:hypothetical protein